MSRRVHLLRKALCARKVAPYLRLIIGPSDSLLRGAKARVVVDEDVTG